MDGVREGPEPEKAVVTKAALPLELAPHRPRVGRHVGEARVQRASQGRTPGVCGTGWVGDREQRLAGAGP